MSAKSFTDHWSSESETSSEVRTSYEKQSICLDMWRRPWKGPKTHSSKLSAYLWSLYEGIFSSVDEPFFLKKYIFTPGMTWCFWNLEKEYYNFWILKYWLNWTDMAYFFGQSNLSTAHLKICNASLVLTQFGKVDEMVQPFRQPFQTVSILIRFHFRITAQVVQWCESENWVNIWWCGELHLRRVLQERVPNCQGLFL